MKPREFLLDITISMPKGESADDWAFVGHMFLDVSESDIRFDRLELARKVSDKIEQWIEKNPTIHDCFDNASEIEEGYICEVCGEDKTEQKKKLLRLSNERKTNPRASKIVTV